MSERTPEQTATLAKLNARAESLRRDVERYGAPWQAPYELVADWQKAKKTFRAYAKSVPPIYGTPLRSN